jgi:hypothetical protein
VAVMAAPAVVAELVVVAAPAAAAEWVVVESAVAAPVAGVVEVFPGAGRTARSVPRATSPVLPKGCIALAAPLMFQLLT